MRGGVAIGEIIILYYYYYYCDDDDGCQTGSGNSKTSETLYTYRLYHQQLRWFKPRRSVFIVCSAAVYIIIYRTVDVRRA